MERTLTRNEFNKLTEGVLFDDLENGMEVFLGGTNEPGLYKVESVTKHHGYVDLSYIPFDYELEDEE